MEEEDENGVSNTSPKNNTSPGLFDPRTTRKGLIFDISKSTAISKTTGGAESFHGYNTGIGESMFDEGITWDTNIDPNDIPTSLNNFRSDRQGGWAELGAGLGRLPNKVGTEIIKTVGALGGLGLAVGENTADLISGEDNHNFLDTTFNNAFIKGVQSFSDKINENMFPVYVNSAIQDGNFMDKISSPEFWSTEGVDGLGFMIAFMAPGAAFKALNLGSKAASLSAKTLANARYAGNVDKAVETMKDLGLTVERFDNIGITAANTLLEAGAESKGVSDDMESRRSEFDDNYRSSDEFKIQIEQEFKKLDELRRIGSITDEEYNEQSLTASQRVLDKAFNDQRGKAMRDTFWTNTLVLAGPNFIQAKMLYGKSGAKDFVTEMASPTLKNKILNRTGDFVKAFGSEGFEEVAQTTAQKRYVDRGLKNKLEDNYITDVNPIDFTGDFFETLGTTEGQIAGFLGGMLGGPMSAYQGAKTDIQDRKKTNRLIDLAKTHANNYLDVVNNSIYDTYEVPNPQTGEVEIKYRKNEDGSLKLNPENIIKIKSALNLMEEQSKIFDEAIASGNESLVEQLRNVAETNLINQFIGQDEMGIDALEQHLNAVFKVNEQDPNTGKVKVNKDNQNRIKEIIDKAKYLQKTVQSFKDFSTGLISLNHKDATKKDISEFYNTLANIYIQQKSDEYVERKKLQKLNNQKAEVLSELNGNENIRTTEVVDENAADDAFKFKSIQDPRIKLLNQKIAEVEENLKEIDEVVNDAIWDAKETNKLFGSLVEQRKKVQEEFNKSPEYQALIDAVKNTTTQEELDTVIASKPDLVNNVTVQAAIQAKSAEIAEIKNKADNVTKADSKEVNDDVKKQIQYVQDNFKVGDDFIVTEDYKMPKFTGKRVVITKISPTSITFETEDGLKGSLNVKNFFKQNFNPQYQFDTEGGETETVEVSKVFDASTETTGGARLISVDDNGDKLSFISESYLDFERNPNIKKTGQEVGFEVNTSALTNENFIKAFEALNAGDFSDMELLIKYLPINAVFNDSAKAPIFTHYVDAMNSSESFDNTTRLLRETIIKELAKGTSLTSIKTKVEGQWNGTLQVEPQVLENSVSDLYEFAGDVKNIKTDNLYIVDDYGALKNFKGKTFPTKRELAAGEIYTIIHTAAGNEFPLKLNVKRISEDQAEVLYELYKYRFKDLSQGKGISMKEIDDDVLKNIIQTNLKEEIEIIGKPFADITVKDLVDFLIWDGTNSIKSRVKFSNTREGVTKLFVADRQYTVEEFENVKDEFIETLTNNKRQHIKFKPKASDGIKSVNFANRKYVEYLINNNVLNTNAKVNTPTFQGKTNVFLDVRGVTIDGKESIFNPIKEIKIDHNKLIGNNTQLKTQVPKLFNLDLKLDSTGKFYVDKKGQKYNRVTSLKETNIDANINVDSTVRGDVIDELIRLQLSSLVPLTLDEFSKRGKEFLKKVNKNKKTKVQFSDKAYNDLYDALNVYKEEFNKRDLIVFSNSPSLGGRLGTKGMFAGTMDLLAYDKKNKQWVIIDVKTSSTDRANSYNDPSSDKFDYIGKDKIQQNTYAELFNQMTGQKISKLYILPLHVPKESSNSFDVDDINYNIDQLFLEIDMSESVYELLKINKTVTKPKVEPIQSNSEFEGIDFGNENTIDLGKFGVLPQKKAPVKKTTTTASTGGFKFSQAQLQELISQLESTQYKEINYAGDVVKITNVIKKGNKAVSGYYFWNETQGKPISDLQEIEKLLSKYNAVTKDPQQRYKIDSVLNIWKSRLNSVSLQKPTEVKKVSSKKAPVINEQFEPEVNDFGVSSGIDLSKFGVFPTEAPVEKTVVPEETKESDSIDFTEVTLEQAENGLKVLRNPSNARFIMDALKRNSNNILKTFEEVYKQTESKLSSEEDIKSLRKKCNL